MPSPEREQPPQSTGTRTSCIFATQDRAPMMRPDNLPAARFSKWSAGRSLPGEEVPQFGEQAPDISSFGQLRLQLVQNADGFFEPEGWRGRLGGVLF